MGKRGPKPKSTAAKKRAGNPGKRNLDKEAHWSPPVTRPEIPVTLRKDAQAIWSDIVEKLFHDGVVSEYDGALLEQYCNNLALLRECSMFIEENGLTYESHTKSGVTIKKYPQAQQLKECQALHLKLSAELGLTPSSRTRIKDPNQGDLFGKEKENKFAQLGAPTRH